MCAEYGYHPLSLRLLSGLIARDARTPGDIAAGHATMFTTHLIQRHIISSNSHTMHCQKETCAPLASRRFAVR